MRKAIDESTLKNRRPPKSLEDLVEHKFLYRLAIDPITEMADCLVKFDDVELTTKQRVNGIGRAV